MARALSQVPRLTLSRRESAQSLGISLDSFERYVQPDLRVIRRGQLVLIPIRELERWVESNACHVLENGSC